MFGSGFRTVDPQTALITIIVVFLSIALHEFGHALSADRLGDDTPRMQGRVTLWPDKHFDPLGFLMLVITSFLGFGLAWGKPVQVNTRRFKHPQRDMIIVALCGPLMNLILAVVFGMILRYGFQSGTISSESVFWQFINTFVTRNLALLFFNLIPIPPLDGSKVLYGLLPFDLAVRYERTMGQFGFLLLMILISTSAVSQIIGPPVASVYRLLIGA